MDVICAANFHLGIIGPYFFESSIDGDEYRNMLEKHVFPALLERMPVRNTRSNHQARNNHLFANFLWMQDGPPAHTTRNNMEYISTKFSKFISQNGDIEWPPGSPDLNALDYWLWGDVKSECRKYFAIDEIEREFTRLVCEISIERVRRAIGQFRLRIRMCSEKEGSHFESQMHSASQQTNLQ